MNKDRKLRLGAFMRPVSIHTASWRYPGGMPDGNFNLKAIVGFAQKLEQGCFDAFFMADHLAVLNMPMDALKRSATVTSFDPLTLLPALAMMTEHLGLIATASTTFEPAYTIAPGGLEPGHHVEPGCGPEFWHERTDGAWRTLPPGP